MKEGVGLAALTRGRTLVLGSGASPKPKPYKIGLPPVTATVAPET